MPYVKVWIAPELFVEHGGVKVYHAYDDEGERLTCWYSTWYSTGGKREFDVELFSNYRRGMSHKDVITGAIDTGYLKAPEDPADFGEDAIVAIPLSRPELNTVLGALRFLEAHLVHFGGYPDNLVEVFFDGGEMPLSIQGIDDLCVQLNCGG